MYCVWPWKQKWMQPLIQDHGSSTNRTSPFYRLVEAQTSRQVYYCSASLAISDRVVAGAATMQIDTALEDDPNQEADCVFASPIRHGQPSVRRKRCCAQAV